MLALVASPQHVEHVELREVPSPTPGPNEAVVAVKAVSLNRGEVNRLAAAEDGAILGWDLAGVVKQAAADGSGPSIDTRVVGFVPAGSWAQEVAVPTNRLAPLPDDVSFAAAAALPVAGVTALRLLRLGGLLLGRRVLITGAAGGVGRFAVQLAALGGASVTGVVGSAGRGEGLRELGAAEIVTDLSSLQENFDLILESVGGPSLAQALPLVAPGGALVTFGNSSREETTINIASFYGRNGARVIAFSLLAPSQPPDFDSDLAYLSALVAKGQLNPGVDAELSWKEAGNAMQALRDRRVRGKAILRVE